jgi:hypothetical protein
LLATFILGLGFDAPIHYYLSRISELIGLRLILLIFSEISAFLFTIFLLRELVIGD